MHTAVALQPLQPRTSRPGPARTSRTSRTRPARVRRRHGFSPHIERPVTPLHIRLVSAATNSRSAPPRRPTPSAASSAPPRRAAAAGRRPAPDSAATIRSSRGGSARWPACRAATGRDPVRGPTVPLPARCAVACTEAISAGSRAAAVASRSAASSGIGQQLLHLLALERVAQRRGGLAECPRSGRAGRPHAPPRWCSAATWSPRPGSCAHHPSRSPRGDPSAARSLAWPARPCPRGSTSPAPAAPHPAPGRTYSASRGYMSPVGCHGTSCGG